MDLLLSKVSLMQKVSQNNPQKYNLYSGLAVLTVTKINQKKLKAHKNSRRYRLASDLLPTGWKRAAGFFANYSEANNKNLNCLTHDSSLWFYTSGSIWSLGSLRRL